MTLNLETEAEKYIDKEIEFDYDGDYFVNGINYLIDGFDAPQYHNEFYHLSDKHEFIETKDLTIEQAHENISTELMKLLRIKSYDKKL